MKKITPHILIITTLFFILSCNGKRDNHSQFDQSDNHLKILLADPVETLDPLKILYDSDWKVASNIFEGLVCFDDSNQIINELVDSINISNDNIDYTFQLKDNVYFHDSPCFKNGKGRELNSYDIKYTFERLASKKSRFLNWQLIGNKISGINEFYQGTADSISGIEIIDSANIKISLVQPYSSFLKILASPNFYIIPNEAINYYKERFEYNPVGTGPFRISEYKKSQKITLVKSENYYKYDQKGRKLPYLNSIEFRTVGKSESILGELIKEKTNLIKTNIEDYAKIVDDSLIMDNYTVHELDKGLGVRFWGFYFAENDYSNQKKDLRKKISKLFYEKYDESKTFPNKIAYSLIPPNLIYSEKASPFWRTYENESERKLDYSNIDTVIIMANLVYKDLLILEDILKENKIPFRREIKPDNYYGEISINKPTLFRVSMIPSFPDPIEYYSLFYSKNSSNVNLSNFKNSEYDKIYEDVQTINNWSEQVKAYLAMEEILRREKAAIYLSHQGSEYYVYSKKIKNIKFRYILPDFRETYFE